MTLEKYIPTIIKIKNFWRDLIWRSQINKCNAKKTAIIYSLTKNNSLKKVAIKRLRELKDPSTLPTILLALEDEDDENRWTAVKAIGEFGDTSCVEPLKKLLAAEKMKEWGGISADIIRTLGNIKDKSAVDVLIDVLKDRRYFGTIERSAAVVALGNIKAEEAIPILQECLQDLTEADSVRNNAAWALKQITGKDYI